MTIKRKAKDLTGGWIKPVSLSDIGCQELSILIQENVKSDTFSRCKMMLCRAAEHQQITEGSLENRTALTQLKNDLNSMAKSLSSLQKSLDSISYDEENILNQYCCLANNKDYSFLESSLDKNGPRLISTFDALSEKMKNGVELYLSELPSPGKGGTKNRRYIAALAHIRKQFEILFPGSKVSPEPDSLFHRLIIIWFNHCLGVDIKDASRHIETLIKETPAQ